MKRLLFVALLLCLSATGQAITANSIVTNTLSIVAAGAPTPVTVTLIQSQPGTATYYYWVVSTNTVGNTLSGPFVITNAPTPLSASASVSASWVPSAGTTYSLLRTASNATPAGACNCAVLISGSASYVTDTGTLLAYVVPPLLTPSLIGPGPAITPDSMEGVAYADQFPGADIGAKVNAASMSLPFGGTVYVPNGQYTFSTTINMMSFVTISGSGLGTNLEYTGSGAAVAATNAIHSSLKSMTINTGTSPTSIGVHFTATSPQACAFNSVSSLTVQGGGAGLISGQQGILVDGNSCVFDSFRHVVIVNVDRPIVDVGQSEGQIWSDMQINQFAASNSGSAIQLGANDDQFYGVRCGLGSSVANPIYCVSVTGQDNTVLAMADLGPNGFIFSDTGAGGNYAFGTFIGSTQYGGVRNGPLYLGPVGTGSSDVSITEKTGANRSLLATSVSGFSNGFTVSYTDSTPSRELDYLFSDGPVGIGVDAAGTGFALDVAGTANVSSSLKWGGGTAIASSSSVALSGANGISAGTITITAGTSGAHTFAAAYGAIPFCTASLESSPPATAISFSIVATTTGVTITSATSITGTFSWICVPAAN